MTIEDKIRAKKEEIKRVNRELSKLQDEARAKNEPLKIKVSRVYVNRISYDYVIDMVRTEKRQSDDYKINIVANCNKCPKSEDIIKAIESLSESSEPKSPIDWSKTEYAGYNWAAIDKSGKVGLYKNKPDKYDVFWADGWGWKIVSITPWAPWDKSLIHRPGIKE